MNKIDSKLYYIIDGDVWQGKSYFDACFKATAEKCHNYGWQYAFNALPKSNEYDEKERYKIAIAGIDEMNRHIVEIESWLIADNYFPTAKQSITENFINYNVQPGWIDTNYMNASLEAGLIEAGLLMNFLNSPKTFELYEKTFGLGHIRIGENSSNKRVFYPTVVQNSLSFIRNSHGNYSHQLIVNSPKYNTELLDGMFQLWDIPKIHCSFTSDSLHNYLYLMNKDYQDDAIIQLDSTLNDYFQESEIYELASESIRDHNSPDNPNIINFKKISPVNPLLLKPHSVRLLVSKKNSSVETNMDNIAILVEKPKILIYNISEQCSIEIYDIKGKKVLHQSFENVSEKINIDFSGQNSGVYIVRISVNGKIITKKIVY